MRHSFMASFVVFTALAGTTGCGAPEPTDADSVESALGVTPHPWIGKRVSIMPRDFNQTRCLDVAFALPNAGTDVNHFGCHGGLNQQFRIDQVPPVPGQVSTFVILRSMMNTSMCLDIRGGTAFGGERLQIFPCHAAIPGGGVTNQQFNLPLPAPWGGQSSGNIRVPFSGMLLDYVRAGLPNSIQQGALMGGRCGPDGCKQFVFFDLDANRFL